MNRKGCMHWLPLAFALAAAPVAAQQAATTPQYPEQMGTMHDIGAGPHLFVHGDPKVDILDPVTLKYQGLVQTARLNDVWWGQWALSAKGDLLYTTTTYYDADSDSNRQDVVKVWKIPTLELAARIQVPPKQVMLPSTKGMMALSQDEHWLFLQNITPAASVSVIDLRAQKTAGEIPLPGCWSVIPSERDALKFATICGDGTFATVRIDAAGRKLDVVHGDKLFDVQADPLFAQVARDGDTLWMVSFNGSVHRIDIAGKQAVLKEKFSIVEGLPDDWKPSGDHLLAFVPKANVMYVLMHAHSYDGSHDLPGDEVWAVDVKAKKVLSRTSVDKVTDIAWYDDGNAPVLFALQNEGKDLVRYEANPAAGYSLHKGKTMHFSGESWSAQIEVK